jgi:hypothetical protein
MKKIYHFVFFSLIIMIFFLERRTVSGVVGKFKCPEKKRSVLAQAVGLLIGGAKG